MRYKSFAVVAVLVLLVASLSVSAFATADDQSDALKSGWYDTSSGYPSAYASSWFNRVWQKLRDLYTSVSNFNTYFLTGLGNTYIKGIHENSVTTANYIDDVATNTSNTNSQLITANGTLSNIYSRTGTTNTRLSSIITYVKALQEVLASDEKRAVLNAQADNASEVADDFLSGSSSSTSVGVGDIRGIKSVLSTVSDTFASPASVSQVGDAFSTSFSSDGGLGFFSQECADALHPSSSVRSLRAAAPAVDVGSQIVTHYYSDSRSALLDWLGDSDG